MYKAAIWMICVFVTVSVGNKQYCFDMRSKYKVQPGRSFGNLPKELHVEYLAARCYRYFCEPHNMAGKGVFKCIPLPGVHLNESI